MCYLCHPVSANREVEAALKEWRPRMKNAKDSRGNPAAGVKAWKFRPNNCNGSARTNPVNWDRPPRNRMWR